jgi:hypothetical protein
MWTLDATKPDRPSRYRQDMRSFECIERPGTPATAVLLHSHPDMGGDRFHPVITALYERLPSASPAAR